MMGDVRKKSTASAGASRKRSRLSILLVVGAAGSATAFSSRAVAAAGRPNNLLPYSSAYRGLTSLNVVTDPTTTATTTTAAATIETSTTFQDREEVLRRELGAAINTAPDDDVAGTVDKMAIFNLASMQGRSDDPGGIKTVPKFNGLSMVPNMRRTRKKSLSTDHPTIRHTTLLQQEKYQSALSLRPSTTSNTITEMDDTSDDIDEPSPMSPTKQTSPKNISGRSSTMPGFRTVSTTNMRSYKQGLLLAEQRIGKKIVESEAKAKKRRALNGTTMYKNSNSVPTSLVQFANEIHDLDRITPQDEVTLGERTQEAIRVQRVYDTLFKKYDRAPTDDEWCAAAGKINMDAIGDVIQEGVDAKNQLIESNLRMVQGVVNLYIRNGLTGNYNAGDLMQEGVMALIRAAEKFDPSRGFRFSTYAMYWIRAAVKRNQLSQSRVIQVPERMHSHRKRIVDASRDFLDRNGQLPSYGDLALTVDLTEAQIERCMTAMSQRCYSIDEKTFNPMKPNDASESTMLDRIAIRPDPMEEYNISRKLMKDDLIKEIYANLSEDQAHLVLLRYGLAKNGPPSLKRSYLTIAEVSQAAGLKPDKVRRTLNRSLEHLRNVMGDEWQDYEPDFQ